ncbi:MAG TPA: TIGR04222 domain-containing membrane protein [Trebonia sp.]|nr:TIGR04222 domain-containing membrane protein [Trebonia sp.]
MPAVMSLSELDVHQVAYVCGGPQRVALAVVAAMAQDGRAKVSRARHRVHDVLPRDGQPVEHAVMEAASGSGKALPL